MGDFRILEIALLASIQTRIIKNMPKNFFLIMKNHIHQPLAK